MLLRDGSSLAAREEDSLWGQTPAAEICSSPHSIKDNLQTRLLIAALHADDAGFQTPPSDHWVQTKMMPYRVWAANSSVHQRSPQFSVEAANRDQSETSAQHQWVWIENPSDSWKNPFESFPEAPKGVRGHAGSTMGGGGEGGILPPVMRTDHKTSPDVKANITKSFLL